MFNALEVHEILLKSGVAEAADTPDSSTQLVRKSFERLFRRI